MKTIKLSKVLPSETLYIGDSLTDIQTCRRISEFGFKPVNIISVTWGFETRERLMYNNPNKNYVVDSASEMVDKIKGLF